MECRLVGVSQRDDEMASWNERGEKWRHGHEAKQAPDATLQLTRSLEVSNRIPDTEQ